MFAVVGGGGAGGSLLVYTPIISGSGSITSNGGTGSNCGYGILSLLSL